jgi:hypothetical protein
LNEAGLMPLLFSELNAIQCFIAALQDPLQG